MYDEDGRPASSLLAYALLTAADVPQLSTAFVETPSPLNPLGVKGIGEAGRSARRRRSPTRWPTRSAAALDPPFTAENVWGALR